MARGFVGSFAWDQALGRLPWFAPFFLRARRLRPVLPMMTSWDRVFGVLSGPRRATDQSLRGHDDGEIRSMNRPASTTTRVTSPVPTSLPATPAVTWWAATVKRCSRPSTYAVVAVTSTA